MYMYTSIYMYTSMYSCWIYIHTQNYTCISNRFRDSNPPCFQFWISISGSSKLYIEVLQGTSWVPPPVMFVGLYIEFCMHIYIFHNYVYYNILYWLGIAILSIIGIILLDHSLPPWSLSWRSHEPLRGACDQQLRASAKAVPGGSEVRSTAGTRWPFLCFVGLSWGKIHVNSCCKIVYSKQWDSPQNMYQCMYVYIYIYMYTYIYIYIYIYHHIKKINILL